jgi:hypothetical protein
MKCIKCNQARPERQAKSHHGVRLCDDCYIDAVMPQMLKAHYDNASEFMNRLKDAYPVRRQQYH